MVAKTEIKAHAGVSSEEQKAKIASEEMIKIVEEQQSKKDQTEKTRIIEELEKAERAGKKITEEAIISEAVRSPTQVALESWVPKTELGKLNTIT
ncbi:MAG: hypothetical protein WCI72_04325 [archaeon]